MSTDLVRYREVEVVEPVVVSKSGEMRNPFAAMFESSFRRAHASEHRFLLTKWIETRDEWLAAKTSISGSVSTRRTYITALDTFWMFLQADPLMVKDEHRRLAYTRDLATRQILPDEYRDPWTVGARDAMGFRLWMEENGKRVATVAHYMAVASSFYQHVIERTEMNETGVEVSLFLDARGATRSNPFRNRAVARPKVNPYGKAKPLSRNAAQRFFDAIKEDHRPLVVLRDSALFKAYILTGRRASEIVGLRWGDIADGPEEGSWQFRYVGKGKGKGKGDDANWRWQPLPGDVYHAIVGYLKADGRWPTIEAADFVFRPISDGGVGNFENVDAERLPENRHIAARRVGQLMDKICARAGLERMHPHQLRHTFAKHLYEATGDIRLVQELLGHEHVNTTQIYVGALELKKDNYSQRLISQLGLQF